MEKARNVLKLIKKNYLLAQYQHAINHPDMSPITIQNATNNVTNIRPNLFRQGKIINQPIDEKIDVSIIIPAYNCEKYIKRCVDSCLFLRGGYRKEIIVVNDGSTDDTAEILKEYQQNTDVKIINQKNGGVSSARNTGINNCRGKYIMFLDSDDYYDPDALVILFDLAKKEQADLCIGSCALFPGNDIWDMGENVYKKNQLAGKCTLKGVPWGKLYKRKIFNDIRFPEGIATCEDTISNMLINEIAGTIATTSKVIYHYQKNPQSISHTLQHTPKALDAYWAFDATMRMREERGIEMTEDMFNFLMYQIGPFTYWTIAPHSEEIKKSVFVLCRNLIEPFFERGFKIHQHKDQLIFQSFMNNNYKAWRFACDLYSRI